MKKRYFLIPLVIIGAPIGLLTILFVIGQSEINGQIDGCNKGKVDDCKELAGRTFFGKENIINPDFARYDLEAKAAREEKVKKDEAERIAKAEAKQKARDEADAKAKAEALAEQTRFLSAVERVRIAQRSNLVRKCETSIKPALKDPGSYRYIDHTFVAQGQRDIDVVVRYSATNSYGGRIQNTQTCSYSL